MFNHSKLYIALIGIAFLLLTAAACGGSRAQSLKKKQQLLDVPVEDQKRLDYYKKKVQQNLPFKSVLWDAVVKEEIKQVNLRGQVLYIETIAPRLYALDAKDGTQQWRFSLNAPVDFSVALVFDLPEQEVSVRNNIKDLSKELDIEIKSKSRDESKVQTLRKRLDSAKERYQDIKEQDVVYFTSAGIIYCLHRETGELITQKKLTFVPSTAPTATTSYIFMGSMEHHWVYQLDVKDYYPKNWFKAKTTIRGRPIYLHPLLYFATDDGIVYAYDIEREELLWSFKAEKSIKSDLFADSDILYVGSTDYALYALDRYAGELLWKVETGAPIMTRPVINKTEKDKELYFYSEGNALYALSLISVPTKDSYGNDITRSDYKLKWKCPKAKQFLIRGREYCYVIGTDDETLYALDPETGEEKNKWSLRLFPVRIGNREAGVVYLATEDGLIYAVQEP